MIERLYIGDTLICHTPVVMVENKSRRDAEREAVMSMLIAELGDDVQLTHDEEGAPHVEGWYVSITHSREIAVIALNKSHKIGIDAEEWRPTLQRVSHKFLSDEERSLFKDPHQLLKAWTIKEAVYKIVGRAAVEFATAIAISSDLQHAHSMGYDFSITSFCIGDTMVTLAQ